MNHAERVISASEARGSPPDALALANRMDEAWHDQPRSFEWEAVTRFWGLLTLPARVLDPERPHTMRGLYTRAGCGAVVLALVLALVVSGGLLSPRAAWARETEGRAVARSWAGFVVLLNRHGRRYGRCGRDHWSGAVGDEGALRLRRSYREVASVAGLFGRAAHRCAVLRSRHRFDRETIAVNAHDLGMVGASAERGLVVAYCRRHDYACVSVTELGLGEASGRRWAIRMGRDPDGIRRAALALQRLIRAVQRDPRHARPRPPGAWRERLVVGRVLRGVGIGVTVSGLAGTIVGGIYAERVWPKGPCDGPIGGLGCGLAQAIAMLMVLPGILTTITGVILWGVGQGWVEQAQEWRLQTPSPARGAAPPRGALDGEPGQRPQRGPPEWWALPPPVTVGWTFRY